MRFKRRLAILLAISMVLTTPAASFATEAPEKMEEVAIEQIAEETPVIDDTIDEENVIDEIETEDIENDDEVEIEEKVDDELEIEEKVEEEIEEEILEEDVVGEADDDVVVYEKATANNLSNDKYYVIAALGADGKYYALASNDRENKPYEVAITVENNVITTSDEGLDPNCLWKIETSGNQYIINKGSGRYLYNTGSTFYASLEYKSKWNNSYSDKQFSFYSGSGNSRYGITFNNSNKKYGLTKKSDGSPLTLFVEPEGQYTITFDKNNGSGKTEVKTNFKGYMSDKDFPATPSYYMGHYFIGWFDSEDNEYTKASISEVKFTEDTTISAKWKEVAVVTFDPKNGDDQIKVNTDLDGYMKTDDFPEDPNPITYFEFLGWFDAKGEEYTKASISEVQFTTNTTIEAKWQIAKWDQKGVFRKIELSSFDDATGNYYVLAVASDNNTFYALNSEFSGTSFTVDENDEISSDVFYDFAWKTNSSDMQPSFTVLGSKGLCTTKSGLNYNGGSRYRFKPDGNKLYTQPYQMIGTADKHYIAFNKGSNPQFGVSVNSGGAEFVLFKFIPEVNYTVKHDRQTLDNKYQKDVVIETLTGLTGDETKATASTSTAFDGFTPLNFDQKTINKNGNTTVTIQYARNSYTVTYDLCGHGDPIEPKTLKFGATIDLASPSAAGWTFDGWFTSTASDATQAPTTVPAGNITIYAKWHANTDTPYMVNHYQQNITDDEYTLATTNSLTGTTANKTAAESKSYTGFTAQPFEQKDILGDGTTVVDIYYDRATNSVTYHVGEQGNAPEKTVLKYGETLPSATAKEPNKWYFVGWFTQAEGKGTQITKMETSPLEVYAYWTRTPDTTYRVVHKQENEDGTYTAVATESIPGASGYKTTAKASDSVAGDDYIGQEPTQVEIAEDASTIVEIKYDRKAYTLSFDTDGHGTNPTQMNVKWGTTPTLATPVDAGWTFTNWYKSTASNAELFTTMPKESITVYAHWTANTNTAYTVKHLVQDPDSSAIYKLAATETLHGTTAQDTEAVASNSIITTYKCVQPSVTQQKIAGSGNTVVEIKYDRATYSITYDMGGHGATPSATSLRYGQKIPSVANVSGWDFDGWFDGTPSNANPVSKMPAKATKVYAHWSVHKSNGGSTGGGTKKVTQPVGTVTGTWTYIPATDKWTFASTEGKVYRNEWAYIYNPYTTNAKFVGSWFFFDANGIMLTGYQWIPSAAGGFRLFYLHETPDGVRGRMYENEATPNGGFADGNGWVSINGVVQVK